MSRCVDGIPEPSADLGAIRSLRKRFSGFSLPMFALIAVLRALLAQASLQNGDFETPALPAFPGYQIVAAGDISPWGIPVNSSVKLLTSSLVSAPSGSQVIDLNGPSGPGQLFQSVATVPGTSYTFSFAFRGNWAYDTGVPLRRMNVRLSPTSINANVSDVSGSDAASVFQSFSFAFNATATAVTVQLTGLNNGPLGALCDAVKLIAASPSPTALPTTSTSATRSATASVSPSLLPSVSETPSVPASPSTTPSFGSSLTGTTTGSGSGTVSASISRTSSPSITVSRTFTATRSATASRTGAPSSTSRPSASPLYAGTACRSCPVLTFLSGGRPPGPPTTAFAGAGFFYLKIDAAANPAFAGATHVEIHAWGSGGGGAFAPGGAGAFVTGFLPLNSAALRGQTLLRIVVGDRGGGGLATAGLSNQSQTAGGGRSAIQILGSDEVTWIDILSVGGGGGAACSRPGGPGIGSAYRSGASLQTGAGNPLFPCTMSAGRCSVGEPAVGAATDPDTLCDAGGGGGFCGGLSAGSSGLGGGGGSSDSSILLCSLGMDGGAAGVPFAASPYYTPGTAGSGSFAAGQPGAVVLIPLNFSTASAALSVCVDDSDLRNPTPSCTPLATAPSVTATRSRSASPGSALPIASTTVMPVPGIASASASASASRSASPTASLSFGASPSRSPTRAVEAAAGLLPPQLPAALLTCDVVAASSSNSSSGLTATTAETCSGCSPGYYLTGPSSCAACPARTSLDATSLILPAVRVAGGVVAFGVFAFALVYAAQRRKGGTLTGGLKRGLVFAVWAAMLLQIIAAVGASAPATLPAAIRGFYAAVNVFAFDTSAAGSIPPACETSDPFAFPKGVLAAPLVMLGLLIATLPFTCTYWAPAASLRRVCCSSCGQPGAVNSRRSDKSQSKASSSAAPPSCSCSPQRCSSMASSLAGAVVRLCVLGLGIAYSPAATSAMSLLDCRSLTVSSDALVQLDGGASLATSGSSVVQVPVLRSQPLFVCWASDRHSAAAALAIAVLIVYLLAWPLLTALSVPLGFRAALAAAGTLPDSAWAAAARTDAQAQAGFITGAAALPPAAITAPKARRRWLDAVVLWVQGTRCFRSCAACVTQSAAAQPLRWCAVWCCGLGKQRQPAAAAAGAGSLGPSRLSGTGALLVPSPISQAASASISTSLTFGSSSLAHSGSKAISASQSPVPLPRAARRTALSAVLPAMIPLAGRKSLSHTAAPSVPPFAGTASAAAAAAEERRASLLPPPEHAAGKVASNAAGRASFVANRRTSAAAASSALAQADASKAGMMVTDPVAAAKGGVGLAAILDAQPPLPALANDPFLSAFAAGDMRPSRTRFAQLELALLFALAAIPVAFAPPLSASAAAGKLSVSLLVLLAAAAATALQRPYVLAWQSIVRVAALLVSALGAILNYLGIMAGINNSGSSGSSDSVSGFATFVFIACIGLLVLLLIALVLTLFEGAGREEVAIRVARVQAEAAAIASAAAGRKSGTGSAGNPIALRLSQTAIPPAAGSHSRSSPTQAGSPGGTGRRSMVPTGIGGATGGHGGLNLNSGTHRHCSGVASVVAAATPYRSAAAAAAAATRAARRRDLATVDLGDDAAAFGRGAGNSATSFGTLSRKASGMRLAGGALRSASKVRARH